MGSINSAASNPAYNPTSGFNLYYSQRYDSIIHSRDNQPECDNWETNYFYFRVRSTADFLLVCTHPYRNYRSNTFGFVRSPQSKRTGEN